MPQLSSEQMKRIEMNVDITALLLQRIFQFDQKDLNFGLPYAMKQYLQTEIGLKSDIDPAGYELFFLDLEGVKNFVYEPIDDQDYLQANDYFAIALSSYRTIYDVGSQLKSIEAKHPNWGKSLLKLIGRGEINILTPETCWMESDRYFCWDNEEEELDEDDIVSRDFFKSYYPEWAYERYDQNFPEDLLNIPQVRNFIDCQNRYRHRRNPDISMLPLHYITLPGWEASAGVIAWTENRNELENDPCVIASDSDIDNFNQIDGCNNGAYMFEFLLNDRHYERNLYIKNTMDLFLKLLKSFEEMMIWITRWNYECQ